MVHAENGYSDKYRKYVLIGYKLIKVSGLIYQLDPTLFITNFLFFTKWPFLQATNCIHVTNFVGKYNI